MTAFDQAWRVAKDSDDSEDIKCTKYQYEPEYKIVNRDCQCERCNSIRDAMAGPPGERIHLEWEHDYDPVSGKDGPPYSNPDYEGYIPPEHRPYEIPFGELSWLAQARKVLESMGFDDFIPNWKEEEEE